MYCLGIKATNWKDKQCENLMFVYFITCVQNTIISGKISTETF